MPDSADDLLGKLRALSSRAMSRERELRQSFSDLEKALLDALESAHGSGSSGDVRIYGPDHHGNFVDGRLFFNRTGLDVGYRDQDDDYNDGVGCTDPELVGAYKIKTLAESPVEWLVALSKPGVVETLMSSIAEQLLATEERYQSAAAEISAQTRQAYASLSDDLESQASRIGYQKVLEDWRKAQVVDVDPETAIALASTMLESVLRHMNSKWGLKMEPDATTAKLFSAVRKVAARDVSPSLVQDTETLLGGMQNVLTAVGGLRNKASIAHGRAEGHEKPTPSLARLTVNSAGVVGTFLMELIERTSSSADAKPSE
jgi:hypothetical protein